MKIVFVLVKTELLLDRVYWMINAALSIAIPVFVAYSFDEMNVTAGTAFVSLFLSMIYCCFMLLGKTGLIDVQYREKTYWTPTEATRKQIVLAKYLFLILILAGTMIGNAAASIVFSSVIFPSFRETVWCVLLCALLFGVYLPLEYKIGYENVKYYLMFLVVGSPLLVSMFIRSGNWTVINKLLSFAKKTAPAALPLAAVVLLISYLISCVIYENKDL